MARIIVSGASGQFGHAAASQLLDMGEDVIALSRNTDKLADLAERGADVRSADFESPDGLEEAMAGGEKLLLISTTMVGERPRQHGNAIDAAKAAGVKHIVYTSIVDGGNPDHPAVEQHDHCATEKLLRNSGVAYTILYNSQYAEAVATAMAIPALTAGSKPDNCGDGKIAFVSRDDCVRTAVAVLTQEGHENTTINVTGPELLSVPKAMELASEMAGKPIEIIPVTDEEMYEYFDTLGVARKAADVDVNGPIPWASEGMVTFGQAIREGYFDVKSDAVERITGQKPRTLRSVFEQYKGAWPA
ncbi:NAD(P)H-binding protein [Aurantiacibacter rhizosphaerae]|uniref:NAD(P)H-binding protein n=1 Tax=Aurantiacibacter rhizosphaerae TaxID=2691582 RepID=A0A844XG60_9SPHN|nr:NAD(P)H-binding protein [Aurantiacibacter rhizosphaerae]